MSNTVTIPVDGIPEGYEVVRIGTPDDELVISRSGRVTRSTDLHSSDSADPRIIVRRIFDYEILYAQLRQVLEPGAWIAKDTNGKWYAFFTEPEFDVVFWADGEQLGVRISESLQFPDVPPEQSKFQLPEP